MKLRLARRLLAAKNGLVKEIGLLVEAPLNFSKEATVEAKAHMEAAKAPMRIDELTELNIRPPSKKNLSY